MRILVYGAGPLGSLFAQQLHEARHDVAILARGQRLADIRDHGIVIHNVTNDRTVTAAVRAVETLAPDDAYDLVLVVMRKNAALAIDRDAPKEGPRGKKGIPGRGDLGADDGIAFQ